MKVFCAILLLFLLEDIKVAVGFGRTCFKCSGINCLRTTKDISVKCQDYIDNCVTVFKNDTVIEKGCFSEISIDLRKKCSARSETLDCNFCNGDQCNTLGSINHKCIQCDSRKDINCKDNFLNLKASNCPFSTSMHSYCFARILDDKNIIRGCSVNSLSQKICLMDEKCFLCLSQDMAKCNNVNISLNNNENDTEGGGAVSFSVTTILFFLTILIQI